MNVHQSFDDTAPPLHHPAAPGGSPPAASRGEDKAYLTGFANHHATEAVAGAQPTAPELKGRPSTR